ncbi:hypothetical protein TWF506_004671 [Arthrobotrys conoides]|uniref:Uncharacterized protein n=1 Tax=Arthrobotrys conoides TaxID=74498 RepID=A0AAN8RI19_9PEZI
MIKPICCPKKGALSPFCCETALHDYMDSVSTSGPARFSNRNRARNIFAISDSEDDQEDGLVTAEPVEVLRLPAPARASRSPSPGELVQENNGGFTDVDLTAATARMVLTDTRSSVGLAPTTQAMPAASTSNVGPVRSDPGSSTESSRVPQSVFVAKCLFPGCEISVQSSDKMMAVDNLYLFHQKISHPEWVVSKSAEELFLVTPAN